MGNVKKILILLHLLAICWEISSAFSDQTVCSKYLVSGLYGVDDAAITDSNSYVSHVTRLPMTQARLYYYKFDHSGKEMAWRAAVKDRQQYIQVEFPTEAVLDTIMLQGCQIPDRWVSTYYLLYSMDGITWTTVTSNNIPKLFHGNNNTHETSETTLQPKITALYLRINPQSWHRHISMRFDVSGCYKVKKDRAITKTTYFRLPTPPYDPLKNLLIAESNSATFQACSRMCHKRKSCLSFTIDAHRMFCQVYSNIIFSKHGTTITPSGGVSYFVRNVADPAIGFRPIPGEILKYKVNEIELNQQKAIDVCKGYQSQLVRMDSETKMKYLQSVIYGNNILSMLNSTLIVSGTYIYPKWKYSVNGPIEINSALWSPGSPNPSNGHCVGLIKTGLASVKCSERFFSICESF